MRRATDKLSIKMLILYLIGLIPVIWFSLRSAPFFIDNGLIGILENADSIFNDPFHITLVKGSPRVARLSLSHIRIRYRDLYFLRKELQETRGAWFCQMGTCRFDQQTLPCKDR